MSATETTTPEGFGSLPGPVVFNDPCIALPDGSGQTAISYQACTPSPGPLPVTGASGDVAAWGAVAIIVGLALVYLKRWRS